MCEVQIRILNHDMTYAYELSRVPIKGELIAIYETDFVLFAKVEFVTHTAVDPSGSSGVVICNLVDNISNIDENDASSIADHLVKSYTS